MNSKNFLEKLLDGVEVEWKQLGEVSQLITKGTTPQKFENYGVNYIKTECIDNGRFNSKKLMYISQDVHEKELKRSILKPNDILFAINIFLVSIAF